MNNKTKFLTQNGIIAALYIVLTFINPLSYGALQFRISTMLLPIAIIHPELSAGLIVGTAIANLNSSLGLIDVIVGIVICSVYCFGITRMKNKFIVTLLYALDSGFLVSLELYYCFRTPILYNIITVGASGFIVHLLGMFVIGKMQKQIDAALCYFK